MAEAAAAFYAVEIGEWQILDHGSTAAEDKSTDKDQGPTTRADDLPLLRKNAGFLPITTGGGSECLLYFLGEDAPDSTVPDFWSLQVDATKRSLAAAKDAIRTTFGASSGENKWTRCEIPETSRDEGVVERPQGLTNFAADTWKDRGAATVVLWVGKTLRANSRMKDGLSPSIETRNGRRSRRIGQRGPPHWCLGV